ncbi:hypothetical protein Cob_v011981 [Colletotrichum orbiculare MAFF 240422]|uniref:Uncharacterized protein n=1 Tax=Colletotrichum orbiculare (strain 104-T / ATCC 96160 / CBS 514.97 / LARS 414 / MAFF 240422) TaxID=1213857 RepID=A0A484FC72_COLOR|nr:hypothetical protein Cob_v011981 [Colletotrichum orbiculare MAFF 240422]
MSPMARRYLSPAHIVTIVGISTTGDRPSSCDCGSDDLGQWTSENGSQANLSPASDRYPRPLRNKTSA